MISVVVPIFNEEENISPFHRAIQMAMAVTGEEWEAVYVNDGSADLSLELLRTLQAVDPHIVIVDLSRNWGHMGAISAGLKVARGDAVVLMDGDFQDPPEVVPQLVGAWKNGAQVVVAVRRSREEGRKILKIIFPLFYKVLGAISDFPLPLDAGIFSLMCRQAVDSINSMPEVNRYLPGLRAWVGYKTEIAYYDRQDRAAGAGKLTFLSRINYAADAITSFSYKPLRLCFFLSCLAFFIGVVFGAMVIFSNNAIEAMGFAVVSAVLLSGSLMFLCMGILGEYLRRVHDQVRNRPLSIINQVYYSPSLDAQTENGYEDEYPTDFTRVA